MISVSSFVRRPTTWIFIATCAIALGFALYTNHVWEDYYITFRASKHLAEGDGLVYNVGQRLQTFTSPLGVLLPALASLLSFNASDTAALWIFRVMSSCALATGVVLLFLATRRLAFPLLASVFVVVCLATDAKAVDFTINGMETGIMIAFFAYALWAMFASGGRRWLHLGLAWAGLMWTRPDGFVTIGALTAGVWLFNDPARTGLTRRQWLGVLWRAGVVTTVVYLPWLIFAWLYYGTPVPHTIPAKSQLADAPSLLGFLESVLAFPLAILSPLKSIDGVFNPAQVLFGGWPELPRLVARTVAAVVSGLWLVGPLRRETKALSFAFFLLCLYLNCFPPYVAAWYLSVPAAIGYAAMGCVLAEGLDMAGRLAANRPRQWVRAVVLAPALAFVLMGCWFMVEAAREMKAQQAIIEDGLRRKIGEWLHENASPGDTVFMEPLGYIGYFSGLRTYDFPGLSSPEVVEAISRLGLDYAPLIRELKPTWLVLRPREMAAIHNVNPMLLQWDYAPVQTFDRRAAVKQLDVHGLGYIEYDAAFMVFKRRQ